MVEVRQRYETKSRGLQANSMVHPIRKIGIVGAGQMGNGIAHVAALAGHDVLLNDISAERINAGLATINGNMARQVGTVLGVAALVAILARVGPEPITRTWRRSVRRGTSGPPLPSGRRTDRTSTLRHAARPRPRDGTEPKTLFHQQV